MRMQGKVAVITGAASGIGKRTAERFVEEGGSVVIADLDETAGPRVAQELGRAARFIRCDVTAEADIEAAVGMAQSVFGRLDLMFNNAGAGGDPSPVASMSAEGWDSTMNLLVRSVMLGIKHAGNAMAARGGGAIVSTASIAGLIAGSTATAYGVAKSAVIYLTKCAALEYAEHKVRINCICPGVIATPIFTGRTPLPSQVMGRLMQDIGPAQEAFQPLPRAGQADDIANGVLYLADDRAGFVTGIALPIDGGFSAGIRPDDRLALWAPLRSVVSAVTDSAR
jgi:NAD(P)-dependent dehydrogenase (short-subunit alcohol dehydrogenase family)